jgi:hypothetical protein
MPTPRQNLEIYQGLTFAGWSFILLDATGQPVAQDVGTTYLCQARTQAGDESAAFALVVVRGTQTTGQIIMAEASAAQTLVMPVGSYVYDIIPIDTDSKPWPPVLTGQVKVLQSISFPD